MDYKMKSTACVMLLGFSVFCLSLSVMCDTKTKIRKVTKFSEWTGPRQLAKSEFKNKTLPTVRLQDVTNKTNETKHVIKDMGTMVFPNEVTTFKTVSNVTTVRDVVTVKTKNEETMTSVVDLNDYDSDVIGNRFGIDVELACPKGYRHTKGGKCQPVAGDSSDS